MAAWIKITSSKARGQGIIEYAGALITASLIVAVLLVSGIGSNSWMYNSYTAIFSAAGNLLTNAIGNL